VVNNTGALQELLSVTGTFYDAQGQVIADEEDTYSYSPSYFIPTGGTVPFELMVEGIQSAADYELKVEAETGGEMPNQDFEFIDLNQWAEDDYYCIEGKVRNAGDELRDYLFIAATVYDSQNNLVNFGDYQEFGDIGLGGDDTAPFQICIGPPNHDTARYDMQAWGQ
jgi:hypothetical protein